MLKIYLLIFFAALSLQPSSVAYTSEPRSVLDYYLLLPDKYFEADKEQRVKWMLDPKRGAIVDVKNGYLYAPGDGAQTSVYVCLFRRTDGNYLIAVKTHASDSTEYTYLDLYVYENGRFLDVTQAMLPVAVNEELIYEMPRYGTTIKVKSKRGRKVYELVWAKDKFRLAQ